MGVRARGVLIGGLLVSLAAGALAGEPRYSNKWRIEIDEGANNDGVLKFRVTPQGEASLEVLVNVKGGRSENGVATDVADAFKAALDQTRYHVEKDDGEDVLVKKKAGPDFSLELLEDTVRGTNVDLERE
jgi:hypothetical protein